MALLTYLLVSYWMPGLTRNSAVLLAASVAFFYILIIELLSKPAVSFLSFPIILRVKKEVDEKNDGGHFYYDHEENQEELTKFDSQVFRYTGLFYSGFVVSLVALVHFFLLSDTLLTLGSIAVSILSLFFLCYLPIIKIKRTITTTPLMYE